MKVIVSWTGLAALALVGVAVSYAEPSPTLAYLFGIAMTSAVIVDGIRRGLR